MKTGNPKQWAAAIVFAITGIFLADNAMADDGPKVVFDSDYLPGFDSGGPDTALQFTLDCGLAGTGCSGTLHGIVTLISVPTRTKKTTIYFEEMPVVAFAGFPFKYSFSMSWDDFHKLWDMYFCVGGPSDWARTEVKIEIWGDVRMYPGTTETSAGGHLYNSLGCPGPGH